jgi:hypothetical protein
MNFNAEQEAARLVVRAKREGERAKELRDDGNIAGAIELLTQTIAALASSPLAVGLETGVEASKPMRDLAAPMADCLGMLGGIIAGWASRRKLRIVSSADGSMRNARPSKY